MKTPSKSLNGATSSPNEGLVSTERRHFIGSALCISAAAFAGTVAAFPAGAAGGNLFRDKDRPSPSRNLIEITAETGEVFRCEFVPGSITEIPDPKLGTRIRMELLFDVFGQPGASVREITDKIEKLATVDPDKHRPPTLSIRFTGSNQPALKAGLVGSTTGFSLFLPDATPVRASVLIEVVPLG